MTDAIFPLEEQADSPLTTATRDSGRVLDLLVAVALLLVMAPIMLLVAAAVYAEDGGTAFFVQTRVGLGGRTFKCIKFRSMAPNADWRLTELLDRCSEARRQWTQNRKLQKDPRVTFVGRFIRSKSLDELPQLFNVVMGDMSLVGPRPIMVEEIGLYGRRLALYKTVRPGMTGLWQVAGRGDTTFRSRIAMDMAYIRARAPLLDLKILLATIPIAVLGRGSY